MLNVSQGQRVWLSTPFGARGFFWKEWHDERADWKRVRVTWRDCPRLSPEAIEDERRAMGDIWVAQEFECSFVALEGLVYPEFARAETEAEELPEGRLVGGLDFGWRNPFAAIWGVLDADDVLWIAGERYASQVPLHHHAASLKELGSVTWYADPSGRTEIEELRTRECGHDCDNEFRRLRLGGPAKPQAARKRTSHAFHPASSGSVARAQDSSAGRTPGRDGSALVRR